MEKREYFGGALSSFILALGHSPTVVEKILRDAGIERLDPEGWYDFDRAIAVYRRIAEEVGRAAIIEVGRKIIDAAEFPPGIDSVQAMLGCLGLAYHMNARGPDVGDIVCSFEDDHSATIEWSAAGPCVAAIGIIEGCCARHGAKPLVEHGADCRDRGARACIFNVSW